MLEPTLSLLKSNATEFYRCRGSGGHDLADNRRVIRNIMNYRMFQASERTLGVLEMSETDYMSSIENTIGRKKL